MSSLITLTCPSCGGRLEIANNIEQYRCVHCGNSHIVDPGVRAESLAKEIEILKYDERIRKVEVDINRLVEQQQRAAQICDEAEAQISQCHAKKRSGLLASGVGAILILIGLIFSDSFSFLLAGGAAFIFLGLRDFAVNDFEARSAWESATQQFEASREAIRKKQGQLAQLRAEQANTRLQSPTCSTLPSR